MGRTKRPRATKRRTEVKDLTSTIVRMSMIAFGHADIENSNVLQPESLKSAKNVNKKLIIKNFKKEVKSDIQAYEEKLQMDLQELQLCANMLKLQIPVKFINTPLKLLKSYRDKFVTWELDDLPEMLIQNGNNVTSCADLVDNISGNIDEPFKKPLLRPKRNKKRTTRNSKMHTPVSKVNCVPNVITPKVNMNKPLSALRHARVGEQAVSITGSPIMVTSMPPDDTATVSVPVNDGRVFTILPTSNFEPDQLPSLDSQTKAQLVTLYRNLASFFDNSNPDDE